MYETSLPDIIKTGDRTKLTDNNLLSALRVLKEIARLALSKQKGDEARGLIKFLAGLETGTYEKGKSGSMIDPKGDAEFGALMTRLKAELAELHVKDGSEFGEYKAGISGARIDADGNAVLGMLLARLKAELAELQVNGAAEFRGKLSSEDFISGFTTGKGWAIFKREVLNALGVPETKYTAEVDDIVIRGALRVFTMAISQLLGENDNRIFTGMMEVDHYDQSTGRVYLQTHDGKIYNPFRPDDYIMVQQYNGMPSDENDHYITKHYELIVTGAGCGDQSDGENRLDWVEFGNFVSADGGMPADVISKGDTFTRVDNATDVDRKGLIQIITVGTATPYIDIVHGMKTDPGNCLKGRLGNLKGIHHSLFGWLDGYGELLTNLYAVGDFRLRRTGESLDAKIEMLRAMFATRYQILEYDLTEDDNYLLNASFTETMEGWTVQDDGKVITSNGAALLMNGNTYIADGRIAGIEELDGRNVLHIKKSGIRQGNALIRKPGTHKEYRALSVDSIMEDYSDVKDTLFLSVRVLARTDGVLTIGMSGATSEPGSLPSPATAAVTSSGEWQNFQWEGTWDGKGDFVLQYTGNAYISALSLTDRALDDFKKEVSTQITQTSGNIRLLGTNINNIKGSISQLGIDLDAAEEQIRIYAEKYDKFNGDVTSMGLRIDAAESKLTLYATQINDLQGTANSLGLRMDAAEATLSLYADRYDSLSQKSTRLGVRIDAVEGTLTLHGDRIDKLEGSATSLGIRLDAAEGSIIAHASRISANETSISALQITTDTISTAVTGVENDLAAAKARIETVADIANAAGDAEVYRQADNPWDFWPPGTESKHVGALWHDTSDGHTYRYIGHDGDDTWEDVTNICDSASYVLQNKGKISAVVGSFDSSGNLTNTSGLVTTAYATQIYATKETVNALGERMDTAEARIETNAGNIALKASQTSVDNISGRLTTAEANIDINSTQISTRVSKDGVISAINQSSESVSISASKIDFNGMVTMNGSFRVEPNGTTHVGGFVVSGTGLTNRSDDGTFTNDAYIIFRNDPHGCFAGIGGNILPAISGARGVARFENYDESDWWGLGHNYAMLVGARGAADNSAIAISGGYVSGFALKTEVIGHDSITQATAPTTKSVTIGRDVNSVYASTHFNWRANSSKDYESKTREVRLTLPDMQPYDNGHIIFIKRGTNNGNDVRVIPGWSYRCEYNSSTMKWETKSGRSYIIYDNESYATQASPLTLGSCGDAMCLIYHRELQITINNVTYYGAWVQHKFPRSW